MDRTDPAPDHRPQVFVSYAHDTEHHKRQVQQLCALLRSLGVDARLDSYDEDSRRDWYVWQVEQIEQADFVLCIASPRYRVTGDGRTEPDRNRGVQAEAAHLRDLLYLDRPNWTRKLLPVVLPGRSIDEIPLFLQPYCASRYVITEITADGVEVLLRTITGQPAHPPPDLGEIPVLPPIDTPAATTSTQPPRMWASASGHARVYQAGRDQHIIGR
jgi:hypothetical protein